MRINQWLIYLLVYDRVGLRVKSYRGAEVF